MLIHIANLLESNRLTVKATTDLPLGGIHKIVGIDASQLGVRTAAALADADAALLVEQGYGLSIKVSADTDAVTESTAPASTGDRIVAIESGDLFVSATNAFVVIHKSLLHSSLDNSRGGTLPAARDELAIKGGLLCKSDVAGAITAPVIARVFEVVGDNVTVFITETPVA